MSECTVGGGGGEPQDVPTLYSHYPGPTAQPLNLSVLGYERAGTAPTTGFGHLEGEGVNETQQAQCWAGDTPGRPRAGGWGVGAGSRGAARN